MPVVYTLIHASLSEFHRRLDYFEAVLAKDPLDPAGYEFDGLAPQAYRVPFKQGSRGGPILALARLLQAQSRCIRILAIRTRWN